MTTIIGKALTKYIGADIYVFAWKTMLNEGPVSAYLDELKQAGGQPVVDYAFISLPYQDIIGLSSKDGTEVQVTTTGQYSYTKTALVGVPKNFFNVMQEEFYVSNSYQAGFEGKVTNLSSGEPDPVAMLFSEQDLASYPETIPDVNSMNAYNITFSLQNVYNGYQHNLGSQATDGYTILVPGIFNSLLPVKAGEWMKIQVAYENDQTLRTMVRATVN